MMRGWRGAAAVLAVAACLTASASAAPVGPTRVQMGRWRVGGEIGIGLGRDWDRTANPNDAYSTDKHFLYLADVAYGFDETWEVFGLIGAANLDVQNDPDNVSPADTLWNMGTESAFGGGVRGNVWPEILPGWDLALDARFLTHAGHEGDWERGTVVGDRTARGWDYTEWQVSALFQTARGDWTYYAGPVFGDAEIEIDEVGGSRGFGDLEAEDGVGILFGTGFDFGGGWTGYVEGRLIDENAVHTGLAIAF